MSQRRFNVYVIELDRQVLQHRRFVRANPQHDPPKACLYVGMTALAPRERFEQHKAGHKSSWCVKKYGRWIRWRLFRRYNPMTYERAQRKERELAAELRDKGYAVWQN